MQLQSEKINELAVSLVKTQGELQKASKDKKNQFFGSNYATLESVIDASRDALVKNDLAMVQQTTHTEIGSTVLVTTLLHSSGQWMRGYYPIHAVKTDPQGQGSAMTYARRYAYASMIGLVQEDDDGESAMKREVKKHLVDDNKEPIKSGNEKPKIEPVSDLVMPCEVHGVEMQEYKSRSGKNFFGHIHNKKWCFGK